MYTCVQIQVTEWINVWWMYSNARLSKVNCQLTCNIMLILDNRLLSELYPIVDVGLNFIVTRCSDEILLSSERVGYTRFCVNVCIFLSFFLTVIIVCVQIFITGDRHVDGLSLSANLLKTMWLPAYIGSGFRVLSCSTTEAHRACIFIALFHCKLKLVRNTFVLVVK